MKILRIMFAFLISVCILAGCSGRKKDAIPLPSADEISKVTIINGDTAAISENGDYISKLLNKMKTAEDTDKKSVRDKPVGDTATRIDLQHNEGGTTTIYMYFNGGKLFLEKPHQGIYSIEKSLCDIIDELDYEAIS